MKQSTAELSGAPKQPALTQTNQRPGVRVHTSEEIHQITKKTGLVCVGNIKDDWGILIPVFMAPTRNEDWIKEHMAIVNQ